MDHSRGAGIITIIIMLLGLTFALWQVQVADVVPSISQPSATVQFVSEEALGANASGNVYYMAADGDTESADGSLANPFGTFHQALWVLQPGDTLYFRGGDYYDRGVDEGQFYIGSDASGSAQAYTTFAAFPGETPVFHTGFGWGQAINISGASYIKVSGLDVGDFDGFWFRIENSNHIIIENGEFTNVTINSQGAQIFDSDYVTISNSLFDRVYDQTVQNQDAIKIERSDYLLFEGNTMTRAPHGLIGMDDSKYGVIRNNTFYNEWQKNLGLGALQNSDLGYNVIENNLIYGSNTAITPGYEGKGGMGLFLAQGGNIVRNNLIYDNENFGLLMSGITTFGNKDVNYTKIYHNVIDSNGYKGDYNDDAGKSGGIVMTDWDTDGAYGVSQSFNHFKNNVITSSTYHGVFMNSNIAGLTDNVFAGNCIYGGGVNEMWVWGVGVHEVSWYETNYPSLVYDNTVASPSYVDSAGGDYHLQTGSPCIDAGVALTNTVGSGSGTVVSVVDAGYFTDGFGIVEGDVIKIGSSPTVQILNVDYASNVITVSASVSWTDGDSVTMAYNGAAPDAGAYETSSVGGDPVCGNGELETGEVCDDGNLANNDQCSSDCQNACSMPQYWDGSQCVDPVSAVCGNGAVETGESCDDGNTSNGDQCSNDCQNSCTWPNYWDGSTCSDYRVCGDGQVQYDEVCDDGNTQDNDSCSADCYHWCWVDGEVWNGSECVTGGFGEGSAPSKSVFRFWSDTFKSHFYTISETERDYVQNNLPLWNHYEGAVYKAYSTKENNELTGVHRFWSDQLSVHFYTISEAEKNYVLNNYGDVWNNYEGVTFYAYQTQVTGSTPVYRFWSNPGQVHFYTNSAEERDYVLENFSDYWTNYEGIVYYAITN